MFRSTRRRTGPVPPLDETRIRVGDSFRPDTVRVVAGRPVRLTFRREDASPCSERIVIPALGETLTLSTGEDVWLDFVPDATGEIDFSCEMGMLRGRIVVDAPAAAA